MFFECSPINSRICSTRASYGRPRNRTQSLRVPDVMMCWGSNGIGSIGGIGSYVFGSIALFNTCKTKFHLAYVTIFPTFRTLIENKTIRLNQLKIGAGKFTWIFRWYSYKVGQINNSFDELQIYLNIPAWIFTRFNRIFHRCMTILDIYN